MAETAPPKRPIFFGITRSFLLGLLPAIVVGLDLIVALTQGDTAGPLAELLVWAFGWQDVDSGTSVVRGVGTMAAFIVAHQRSGATRAYTTEISKETMK